MFRIVQAARQGPLRGSFGALAPLVKEIASTLGWSYDARVCTVWHLAPYRPENRTLGRVKRARVVVVCRRPSGWRTRVSWLVCCTCHLRMGVPVESLPDELERKMSANTPSTDASGVGCT